MIVVQIVLCFLVVQVYPPVGDHLGFIISAIVVLTLFCIMIFAAARIAAASTLARLFIQLVMIAVFLKMLVCLALIIGYKKGFAPADNAFIWPFLIIYVTSTIYEVIFLEKTGRPKKHTTLP